MDQILSAISVISAALVSIFSVALPQILENKRLKKEFEFKQTQLYLENKYSAYKELIAAYSYPRFDANRIESKLELKRAIFLAISVSDSLLADDLQTMLSIVDEPAISFHQNFQPAFLRCLSLISQEYTNIVEFPNTHSKSR